MLILASADVIKAKNSYTKGGDNVHFESINLQRITKLSRSLKNGSWRPGVVRRLMIPKKKVGEYRSLRIISPYDKIVASAIKITLSAIFEKHDGLGMLPKCRYFSDSSHGFRPNRNCHSALNVIPA